MRTALKRSLNIPAVTNYHLVNNTDVSNNHVFEDVYVKLTGNEYYRGKLRVPSAAIGGVETSLTDQVQAYSTLASEGMYREQKFVLEIKDDQGKTVESFRKVEGKQVIEKKYTFLINDMNQNYWLFRGESFSDPLLTSIGKKMYIGGKTGTADNDKGKTSDTAFIAYTPTFVLGMWAGNSCRSCEIKQGASGEDLYKLLYKPFLDKYQAKIEPAFFYKEGQAPEGVKRVEVCNMTGNDMKSSEGKCTWGSHTEWIASDSAKKENMIETISITQCGDTEKRASQKDKDEGFAQEKSYFVYKLPAALKSIQDQINSKKNLNPPAETCSLDRNTKAPEVTIVSPANGANYSKTDNLKITAFVTAGLPVQRVEFFVGKVGQSRILVQTFNTQQASYEYTVPLDTYSNGDYTVTVVATDSRGSGKGEGSAERVFSIGPAGVTITPTKCTGLQCLFVSPTPSKKPNATVTPTKHLTATPTPSNFRFQSGFENF
jgi:membrane peptidoglycan carboxypeptidase